MEGPRSWGRQLCPRQLHCQKMLCYSWTRVLGRVRLCDVWSSSHSMLSFQAQETLSHLMTTLSLWSWEPSPGTMWHAGEATRRDQLLQNSVHTDLIRSIPGGPGGKSVLDLETHLQEPGLKPHHAVRPVTISFVVSLRHFYLINQWCH